MKRILTAGALPLLLFLFSQASQAQTVTNLSGLSFPTAVQGAGPVVIPPGTAENAQNASFRVDGTRNTVYTIILPVSAVMTRVVGGQTYTIQLTNFTSFPSGTGRTATNGRQTFYVGATRATIPLTNATGSYSGSFTVTVVY